MRKTEIEETNMTDINKIENGPMLNLYPDSLGGDLEAVADLFERDGFADAFSSMYTLPSIYHSDLDRGFSMILRRHFILKRHYYGWADRILI